MPTLVFLRTPFRSGGVVVVVVASEEVLQVGIILGKVKEAKGEEEEEELTFREPEEVGEGRGEEKEGSLVV